MEIYRSSNRMAYGMIIAACIVGAAMTANIKAGPQLLGINTVAIMLFALAIVFGLVLMLSIRKEVRVKQT